ncbi:glycosyltransferase family 2 protein [Candidatus Gottesmanbacteria bacterium]|nr:glycosyltransferase family 2 protein [Candidatus Gottesmanbacteria bacterium]
MKLKKPQLVSIVIPCYNEERRIEALRRSLSAVRMFPFKTELILVDDGSTDGTVKKARRILTSFRHTILRHRHNLGKGAAVKTGILAARGQFIIFSDADFSTPIEEISKLLQALETCDVVIGVRRHPKSNVLRHQPKLREFLGHVFTQLTNFFLIPGIYDATCGFKGYRKEPARILFTAMKIKGWAFDAEILFLVRKYRMRIAQVPVKWSDNPATKVYLLRDGLLSLLDLVKIRWFDLIGVYDKRKFAVNAEI